MQPEQVGIDEAMSYLRSIKDPKARQSASRSIFGRDTSELNRAVEQPATYQEALARFNEIAPGYAPTKLRGATEEERETEAAQWVRSAPISAALANAGIAIPDKSPPPPPQENVATIGASAEDQGRLLEMLRENPQGVYVNDARTGKRRFISPEMLPPDVRSSLGLDRE